MARLVLPDLPLDVQIQICKYLRPLQILALRQTCQACHEATSQRIVWIEALHRVCDRNSLFLPSFPILEMSDSELERAATAPSRWVVRSFSKDRNVDGVLPSRRTRIIENLIPSTVNAPLEDSALLDLAINNVYLLPGGRYLVASNDHCLGVWDLGYTVLGMDTSVSLVWATTMKAEKIRNFVVQAIPDGLGIRILAHRIDNVLCVFDIYSSHTGTHENAQIAELTLNFHPLEKLSVRLYGNRAGIYAPRSATVVVWDFMANTVASWSVATLNNFQSPMIIRIMETTMTMFYYTHGDSPVIQIYQIPPLVTTSLVLFSNQEDRPQLAPMRTLKINDICATCCQRPEVWYFDHRDLDSPPFYLDVYESRTGLAVGRCTLDFPHTPVHPLSATQNDFGLLFPYRICEDSLVYHDFLFDGVVEVITTIGGLDLSLDCCECSRTATTPLVKASPSRWVHSFCPASGRCVFKLDVTQRDLVIYDFL